MKEFVNIYIDLITIVVIYMSAWFLISVLKKRNDVADIAWGMGFAIVAVTSFYWGQKSPISYLVTTLVIIWALRLSFHIYLRNRKKGEDYRYKKWREEWGKLFYIRSFFQVYLLQGALMLIVVTPTVIANLTAINKFNFLTIIGLFIWIIGFLFETIGDWQLSRFIKDPMNQGKIIKSGLWRYTRHPNYFGEVSQWWGIWVIAISAPYGWIGIIGPLTISYLILRVSGIPLLEKKMAENPEFEEYKKETSIFFPMFPKKN